MWECCYSTCLAADFIAKINVSNLEWYFPSLWCRVSHPSQFIQYAIFHLVGTFAGRIVVRGLVDVLLMYAHRWCLLTLVLIANVKLTACQNGMVVRLLSKGLHYHTHLLYCAVTISVCCVLVWDMCMAATGIWQVQSWSWRVFGGLCVWLALFRLVSSIISKLTILYWHKQCNFARARHYFYLPTLCCTKGCRLVWEIICSKTLKHRKRQIFTDIQILCTLHPPEHTLTNTHTAGQRC